MHSWTLGCSAWQGLPFTVLVCLFNSLFSGREHNKPTPQFIRQIADKTLLLGLGSTVFRDAKYTSHEVTIDDGVSVPSLRAYSFLSLT